MAITQVTVCNSALLKVGADRISSITQNTRSAIALNAVWDTCLEKVLREGKWNHAKKRATLAPRSDTPPFEYDFWYDLPNDYIRPVDTYTTDIDFVVENGKILTNEETLDFEYVFRNVDFSSWDGSFAEAMAWCLAESVAYALTQSTSVVAFCQAGYKTSLASARSQSGMEGIRKDFVIDSWTGVRR